MTKHFKCSDKVRTVVRKHSHNKCNTTHSPSLVKGRLLNRWLEVKKDVDTNHFEPTKDYQICKTLHLTITKANVNLFNTTINATPTPSLTPPTTRPLASTSSSKAAAPSTKSYTLYHMHLLLSPWHNMTTTIRVYQVIQNEQTHIIHSLWIFRLSFYMNANGWPLRFYYYTSTIFHSLLCWMSAQKVQLVKDGLAWECDTFEN